MAQTHRPLVLLRSGWQVQNIGDIAHTPGVLALLRRQVPEADVVLWPNRLSPEVIAMLRRVDPALRILDAGDDRAVEAALRDADLFLHGSGPHLVGWKELARWRETSSEKPFGVFGITLERPQEHAGLLDGAAFIFTRETASMERVRASGIRCGAIGFVPDGTFALDIAADDAAERTLASLGLEAGRFICLVPRLRYTPYHLIHAHVGWTPEKIRQVTEHNARFADVDHAKLRSAAIAAGRDAGHHVLACPEMTYQVDLLESHVIGPLPDDVRARARSLGRYWLTDEAAGVYARASAVVSLECHSPIIAIAHGTPALYVRQPEDTIKGRMYDDLGLGRWKLDIDDTSGDELAGRVMELLTDPAGAREQAAAARRAALDRCAEAMAEVRAALGLPR